MTRLNIARILLLIGLGIGLESLMATFSHIGDPIFLGQAELFGGPTHTWYHALREGVGDVGAIAVLLLVFFGKPMFRSAATWWITLVVLVGYYAPFWVGMPFNSALAAPTLEAEVRHIIQAVLPFIALFLARADFSSSPPSAGE